MNDRLDLAPCGFAEFGDDGIITYANTTFANLVGWPAGELAGKKFESLLTLPNRIFYQTHFFPLLKLRGVAAEIFLSLLARDGSSVPVLTSARRHGQTIQCVFLVVAERQKYEAEILAARRKAEEALQSNAELKTAKLNLEQQARDLDYRLQELVIKNQEMLNVSRMFAHDLREPMRKVRLFGEIVRENAGATLSLEGEIAFSRLLAESERALLLISEIQRFLEAGTGDEPVTRVSLNAIAGKAAQLVRETESDWELEIDPMPAIDGRPRQLVLLFEELFQNAVKFRSDERPLRVRVSGQTIQLNSYQSTKDRYVYRDFAQIEITDNGRGFDPKYESYVFELFKKIDLGSQGLGIGLAICARIAAAHYGTITVKPELDNGLTVVLRLPVEK